MTHEVSVLCDCPDIEHCRMEVYISDVRIAYAEIERLEADRDADRGLVRH